MIAMLWFRAALVLLLLAGCDEMRRPQPRPELPPGFVPSSGDPMRGVIDAAAASFTNMAAPLQGQPVRAAQAVAQLEALADQVETNARWRNLPPGLGHALRLAREEERNALGAKQDVPPRELIQALGRAAQALGRNDEAGAAAALPARLFTPGGEETLRALSRLGPLPAGEQATAALAREVARLDAEGGWEGGGGWTQTGPAGAITDGLGLGY